MNDDLNMLNYNILGLMSGSSLDGVDLVIVEFKSEEDKVIDWKLLATHHDAFDGPWKKRLESAPRLNSMELSRLHTDVGILFGEMCSRLIEATGIQPDYIASHGHTVFHAPEDGFSVQIGSPSHIAARSGVPVISDFRSNDIAHGGQGAPLAPVVEKYLFTGYGFYLNLGGIANLSAHTGEKIKAWDICPCNQLLNYLAAKKGLSYDNKGEFARQGSISPTLMEKLTGLISLPLNKPFSLDNTFISNSFVPILQASDLIIEDKLRTIVDYISECIKIQIAHSIQDANLNPTLLLTGGGAHNLFLVEEIRNKLKPIIVDMHIPDDDIIDFKEAVLMALCGLLRVVETPNALASVTGAYEDTINGGIYLP
jgi:anhydro-N-acetylmuramic acid kinase